MLRFCDANRPSRNPRGRARTGALLTLAGLAAFGLIGGCPDPNLGRDTDRQTGFPTGDPAQNTGERADDGESGIGDGGVRSIVPTTSDSAPPTGGGSGGTGQTGGSTPGGADVGSTGDPTGDIIAQFTALLSDKFMQIDSTLASSDSDRFSSSRTDLGLCASGRFGMHEFISFSFSDPFISSGGFSSEEDALGTWAVVVRDGGVFIELNVEQSSDSNFEPVRRFRLEQDADGTLFVAGAPVTLQDLSADCAADQAGGGAPDAGAPDDGGGTGPSGEGDGSDDGTDSDPIAQIEAALANSALVFESQTRILVPAVSATADMTLSMCENGEANLVQVQTPRAPGEEVVDESTGTWSVVEIAPQTVAIVYDVANSLSGVTDQQIIFELGVDDAGNLLVDDSIAQQFSNGGDCSLGAP
ncbi:MAG: hypothetical protein HRF50_04265 [Phycisphaerae bacterium]|jgi:hypothetical protein